MINTSNDPVKEVLITLYDTGTLVNTYDRKRILHPFQKIYIMKVRTLTRRPVIQSPSKIHMSLFGLYRLCIIQ